MQQMRERIFDKRALVQSNAYGMVGRCAVGITLYDKALRKTEQERHIVYFKTGRGVLPAVYLANT